MPFWDLPSDFQIYVKQIFLDQNLVPQITMSQTIIPFFFYNIEV